MTHREEKAMRIVCWFNSDITIGEIQLIFGDGAHEYVLDAAAEPGTLVLREPERRR